MEQQKQNILFEKDIKVNQLSNIYEEMENEHKIETPFSKKLKVKKQEVLLANTDTDMEQTTITIKPKRKYTKKPKVAVVEVPAPLTEAEEFSDPPTESDDEVSTCKGCGEVDGEGQYDGYCETCYAEKLGHYPQATDKESDDEGSDDEEVVENPIQTLTTKIILTKEQLADLERQRREIEAKAEYDAWFNNEEQVEADTMTYYKAEIEKSIEVLKRAGIDGYIGEHLTAFCDDAFEYKDIQPETIELVWKFLQKKKNPKSAPKPKGEKVEKKVPTYEGKGKKAGTGDARAKCIERLNAGTLIPTNLKKVGDEEWGSYSGGYPAVKKNGKWDCPTFKILKEEIGVKTISEYAEWLGKQ